MELRRPYRILTLMMISLLIFNSALKAYQQQDNLIPENDSITAVNMLSAARQLYESGEYDSVLAVIDNGLEIALNGAYEIIEADYYHLLGQTYDKLDEWELTLRYALKSASVYDTLGLYHRLSEIYRLLGTRYYEYDVYNKAAEYFIKTYNIYETGTPGNKINISYNAAISLFRDDLFETAIPWFQKSYSISETLGNTEAVINSLFGISASYMSLRQYDKALEYINDLIIILEENNKPELLAEAYNSKARIYFERKNYYEAIENYTKSADFREDSGLSAHEEYTNIAICYQNLESSEQASSYFEIALDQSKKYADKTGQARIEHILAEVKKNEGDYYHAEFYSKAAIESARADSAYYILQESYLTYSEVLEQGNDFVRALDYYEKYLSLRDSLVVEERLEGQEAKRRRTNLENLEQQLRLSLADEELKDVMIDKLRIENEKRENELRLVEQERELERSERERLEQSIALSRERYNREMQEQQIRNLEQEQAIQRLEIIRQENEERELLRTNQLQESEIRQQQLEIEKEHEATKRAIWMAVLMGIIGVLILVSFISTRRKNIILSEQKNEISEQKDIIEEKNQSITDSIEYASRIQKAVLPPHNFLNDWNFENFIFFRPKDIVSGDFYWGQRKGDLFCFAAADCTGHGVPGAFMSMLGNAYLNDIINSQSFNNAGDILNLLRKEVIKSLKQKGEEGEAQDGMDIALCLYNRKTNNLDFAGANNPLYLVRDNELLRYDADKMPIGIHRSSDKSFTNHSFTPQDGDIIYLFSDGYADQFGGPNGKKYKYKAFRDLLLMKHKKPMLEQCEILEKEFLNWKGDIEQVDDVLVIGVKFTL